MKVRNISKKISWKEIKLRKQPYKEAKVGSILNVTKNL